MKRFHCGPLANAKLITALGSWRYESEAKVKRARSELLGKLLRPALVMYRAITNDLQV